MCTGWLVCFPKKSKSLLIILALLLICDSAGAQDKVQAHGKGAPSCRRVVAIILSGHRVTNEAFIRRELQVKEGGVYCSGALQERLQKSRTYLFNMTLFHEVAIESLSLGEDAVAILVHVKERGFLYLFPKVSASRYSLAYWYNKLDRSPAFLNYSLAARHLNVTGRGDRVDLSATLGATQIADISYNYPYLGKKKEFNIKGQVAYSLTRWVPYHTQNHQPRYVFGKTDVFFQGKQVSVTLGYRPYWKIRHSLGLGYHEASIADDVHTLNPNFFANGRKKRRSLGLFYSFQRDTRDNVRFPLAGDYVVLSVRHSGVGLWNREGFWTSSFSFFKYMPLTERFLLQYEMLNYYTYPRYNGYYLRANLNSVRRYSLRGYNHFLLEGRGFSLARTQLRGFLCTLRLPLHRKMPLYKHIKKYTQDPIVLRFYPYVFTDAAWVASYPFIPLPGERSTSQQAPLNDTLLYTMGIGLDVVTFYDFTYSVFYSWNRHSKYRLGFNLIL